MSKFLNDKDFFICSGGMMPTQMLALQDKTGKKNNKGNYLRQYDVYTTPVSDFACKKLMVLMAIVAVVVCALTIATGGAALIAAAAVGGLIGAAIGSLICGHVAALARKWIDYKPNVTIGGQKALTDKAYMVCQIFGDEIYYTPHIKTWGQALLYGLSNFATEMFKCVMVGAAAAGIAVIATDGLLAFGANALRNYLSTLFGEGLLLRLGFAGNQMVQERYGSGQTDMQGAFERGFWGMETGTADAATHIKDAVINGDTTGLFAHGNAAMDRASKNAYNATKPLAYLSAGTGYLEDFTALLGWGAGKRSGSGEPIFKGRGTVEPNAGFDPMGNTGNWEGKPQSGKTGYLESPRISRAELKAYREGLKSQGVDVVVDKKGVLPVDKRAGFDYENGKVYLRKGATHYEAFHEKAHAQQWAEMGKENYLKQSRLQREQHVYDQIMKNKDQFSPAELEHARNYMNEVRRQAGLEPLEAIDAMGQNAKGKDGKQKGDGDTFEDPALVRAAEEKAKATEEQGKAKNAEAIMPGDVIAGKEVVRVMQGTNGKVAVIGRSMKVVEPVGAELKNRRYDVELFNEKYQTDIDAEFNVDGKITDWDGISKDFGNPDKYQPRTDKGWINDEKIPETDMYKADKQWAEKLKKEGYTVIDMGNPDGLGESKFYNVEQEVIFGEIK